jgi:hypothetical protein
MRADDQDKSAPAPKGEQSRLGPGADKSFLGPEFVTWLYFHLEDNGWMLDLGTPTRKGAPALGTVGFAMGEKAVLRPIDAAGARVTLAGPDLDDSGELLQAVRRGALVDTLELQCAISERVYKFTLRASDGGLATVKLPDLFSEPDDDEPDGLDPLPGEAPKKKSRPKVGFDELLSLRMACLEEIEAVIDALFQRFVTRRVARAWQSEDVHAMRQRVASGLKRTLPDA